MIKIVKDKRIGKIAKDARRSIDYWRAYAEVCDNEIKSLKATVEYLEKKTIGLEKSNRKLRRKLNAEREESTFRDCCADESCDAADTARMIAEEELDSLKRAYDEINRDYLSLEHDLTKIRGRISEIKQKYIVASQDHTGEILPSLTLNEAALTFIANLAYIEHGN